MINVYGFYGTVVEVRGSVALFEFSHPSEPNHKQKMWVPAEDAGITPLRPLSPVEFTGGGIVACHPCGNAHEECECPSP
jgi:hypothetical protein